MAEDIDVAQPADASLLDRLPMRDEDGEIRHEFVDGDLPRDSSRRCRHCCARSSRELHEADLGDLIEALEPDDRVSLVELTGADFDFSALNEVDDTVREEILEELEPETVAEGVRELESDDAVEMLEGLDEEDQEEILEKLPPSERVALERSLDLSGKFRRAADADRVHRGAAGLDRRADHRLHARHAGSAGPLLRNLCGRRRQALLGAVPLDALLRARRPVPMSELMDEDRRRVSRHRRPGGGGAAVRQVQSGRRARGRYRRTGWSASSPSTTSST